MSINRMKSELSHVNHSALARWLMGVAMAITCCVGVGVAKAEDTSATGRAWVEKGFLHVNVGDYKVKFWQKAAWTICAADYQQHPLLVHTGAYQSVLKVRGEDGGKSKWIGTGHGGEKIHSIALEVDDNSYELNPELSAQGSVFTVVKRSTLGPYLHTTRVTVSSEGIKEDFEYEMQGEPVDIALMYAFMHCFTNETQAWVVGAKDGQEIAGEFTDDNSFSLKQDIRWAMVYAPSSQVGLVYAYPQVYEGTTPLRNAFWNRPSDNKLYLAVMPSQQANAKFGYSVQLRAFSASEQEWQTTGQDILKAMPVMQEQ